MMNCCGSEDTADRSGDLDTAIAMAARGYVTISEIVIDEKSFDVLKKEHTLDEHVSEFRIPSSRGPVLIKKGPKWT